MTEQMSLWDFDGATYERERDQVRLSRQTQLVFDLMKDGKWRSLFEISWECNEEGGDLVPEASVSARLRDLRKPRFGGHTVERRYVENGLWEYRLEIK